MNEIGPPPNAPPVSSMTSHRPPALAFAPAPPAEIKPVPRWMWISGAVFLVLMGLLTIPVYRTVRVQMHLESSSVRSIHIAMRKADDATLFNDADLAYRQQVGRKKSDELFDWVRSSMGAPHASKRIGTYASTTSQEGTVLTLTYRTTFDKGVGTETFKLHKVDGKYLLLSYTVRSPQIKQQDVPRDLSSN